MFLVVPCGYTFRSDVSLIFVWAMSTSCVSFSSPALKITLIDLLSSLQRLLSLYRAYFTLVHVEVMEQTPPDPDLFFFSFCPVSILYFTFIICISQSTFLSVLPPLYYLLLHPTKIWPEILPCIGVRGCIVEKRTREREREGRIKPACEMDRNEVEHCEGGEYC